ncbi:MAG: DUF4265 domain-containing protein [Myxococcales bacterium]|nr:DUF4265 domain-containing protein [Myxococcales bacterium]
MKLLLPLEREDGSQEVESVWAVPTAHGYSIDNIPFYARGLALGDVVGAEMDEDGMLRCTSLLSSSGHSTVRLAIASSEDVQSVRDELRKLGCPSELDFSRLVAVDIPPDVPYSRVRALLDEKERAGILEYEEGCLGQMSGQRRQAPMHAEEDYE